MFGSKKRRIQTDGAQAIAIVTNVEYAKVLGTMTVARNYNYKLDLTLMVRPDNEAPFEAHLSGYFAQYSQPSIGDQLDVRYDPSDHTHVEIDEQRIAADNAAAEASVVAVAASAVPEVFCGQERRFSDCGIALARSWPGGLGRTY